MIVEAKLLHNVYHAKSGISCKFSRFDESASTHARTGPAHIKNCKLAEGVECERMRQSERISIEIEYEWIKFQTE